MEGFDYMSYLNGLTRFVFKKDALENIAWKNGLNHISSRSEICQEIEDHCLIDLFELVVNGPWSVASSSKQHGSYRQDVGSETVTAAVIENIKARLKHLYAKYGLSDKANTLSDTEMSWINENSLCI